jgi:hypothetical protein
MATATQFEPFKMKNVLRFCDIDFTPLKKPFVRHSHVMATDGRIALMYPTDKDNSEPPDGFRYPDLGLIINRFHEIPDTQWSPWPEVTINEDHGYTHRCMHCSGKGLLDFDPCDICAGTGTHECDKCGHEDECKECNGRGGFGIQRCQSCKGEGQIAPESSLTVVGSGTYNRTYIERIKMYEPIAFFNDIKDDKNALFVKCKECMIVVCNLKRE